MRKLEKLVKNGDTEENSLFGIIHILETFYDIVSKSHLSIYVNCQLSNLIIYDRGLNPEESLNHFLL